MKVFITGATGVLGKRTLQKLLAEGVEVCALSRSAQNSIDLKEMGVEPREADLFDPAQLIGATKGCEAIFHLATKIPKKARPDSPADWAENDRIRTEGTRNLLHAAKVNGITRFLQQSVTFLYGDHHGKRVTPDSAILAGDLTNLASSIEMESLVRGAAGIDHIILRFGLFYSADSYNTQQTIEQVRTGKMPIIGKGGYYWNFIHVDDAADATAYAFRNFDRLRNRTLNFTDFSPIQFKDMVNGIADLIGAKKPARVPVFLARLFLNRSVFRFLTGSHRIEKETIIEDWQPKYRNLLDGMAEIVRHAAVPHHENATS